MTLRECRLVDKVERKRFENVSNSAEKKTVNLSSCTETFVSKTPQFVFSFCLDQCRVFTYVLQTKSVSGEPIVWGV